MKLTIKQAGFISMILAIQIGHLSLAKAQNRAAEQDLLVAPLPEILISRSGLSIESPEQWETLRRPEILDLFRDHVYGRVPESDVKVDYRLVYEDREALQRTAIQKEVLMELSRGGDTMEIPMLIFLPREQHGPVPLFLGLNFNGNHSVHPDPNISVTESWVRNNQEHGILDNRATEASRGASSGRWPVDLILSRGYGLATIYYGDIDPDFDDGFRNGIFALMDPGQPGRGPSSWGSIAAWAWGLSRAMDYFERDTEIDSERVALMGHSRLGKTSLWAGAQDERFSMVISNNSGCGGASLSRRPYGERVSNINTSFPHWFASRFHDYNENEAALPVDQHMLMALMAPRALYVASAGEDDWADQRGEYLSLVYGSKAFQLYNRDVFLPAQMPRPDQPVSSGKLGYHIRTGGHDVTRYDWEKFLDFADRHLQAAGEKGKANPLNREWMEARLFKTHPRLILTPRLVYEIPQQMDVAEMASGVALAIDWGGEYLSPEVEQLARQAFAACDFLLNREL
ncbi:MAG: acetylxylan esterase [Bacteroidales bacterium]|nr:acetylxylan esterase [Bacteroidales bacterium]